MSTLFRSRRGSAVVEAPAITLIIVVLMAGMVEIGKIGITYYGLKKTMFTIARYAATQQGVNFCDPADPTVTAAINLGMTGTTDNSAPVIIPNLTPDMFTITIERVDPTTFALTPCDCSNTGCDISQGGGFPDYVVVTMPNGYSVSPRIPFTTVEPFPLKPIVKVPFGGS